MKHFVAYIHKDQDSDYGVSFHDFPGCTTVGSTLDEAIKLAKEALAFHIKGMQADGDNIPEPSSVEIVQELASKDHPPVMYYSIPYVERSYYVKRYNITMDDAIMKQVDVVARQQGLNRSAFLARVAEEYIREHC